MLNFCFQALDVVEVNPVQLLSVVVARERCGGLLNCDRLGSAGFDSPGHLPKTSNAGVSDLQVETFQTSLSDNNKLQKNV